MSISQTQYHISTVKKQARIVPVKTIKMSVKKTRASQ